MAKDKKSALEKLTPRQRKFVLTYLETNASVAECARVAGYLDPYHAGYQAMRLEHVRRALDEEAVKRLSGGAALGARVLIEIAEDVDHKDRLKAATQLIAHAGHAPVMEQKITVEKTDLSAEAVRDEIRRLMGRLPEAPRLLEAAGLVVDAEFNVVEVERPE